MKAVVNCTRFINAVQDLKGVGGNFTTTYFAGQERTEAWVNNRVLSFVETQRGMLIFRKDRDFYHLYHVAADLPALSEALAWLGSHSCPCVIVADVVGSIEEISRVEGVYHLHGFHEYKSLTRMARLALSETTNTYWDPEVTRAIREDSPEISFFLERMLDPFVDQIPNAEDLADAIERGNVLVLRQAGTIAGILIFETIGVTSQIRYWYVHEQFRGIGVGGKLISAFFLTCRSSKRFVLWVVTDNVSTIAKYQHYGFSEERLVDRILIRRNS